MRAKDRLELENELRLALERGEFSLHYQPILSLQQDTIIGFESLLRWKSPSRGPISPAEFIPIAEETGLIVPIGEWVLREACAQLRRWQDQFPAEPALTVNVNISGVQFAHPELFDQINGILDRTGLAPSSLKLEITESVFMENAGHAQRLLLKLRDLGVQLQIDDFGTGYSSLAYLQHFPIQAVKSDRSFINRIGAERDTATNGTEIVKTIVALARDLGLETVAEGVETQEQLSELKRLNCQYGQGFLMARPMAGPAIELMLAERGELAVRA
jgi:EAL domain-containing protein (putative c-di-GMP-specific phosphodiesterase class I)